MKLYWIYKYVLALIPYALLVYAGFLVVHGKNAYSIFIVALSMACWLILAGDEMKRD